MNKLESQKGISLIITFFIMIIVLAVVLSLSVLLYSEIKVIRNIGNSTISFYAAESGIEKVLFYDRQVLVTGQDEGGKDILAGRGLCMMLDSTKPNYCVFDPSPDNFNIDHSIYCNNPELPTTPGCDPLSCNDCTISFDTVFFKTNSGDAKYSVAATVDESYYLNAGSRGTFSDASRKIEITLE